MAWTDSRHGRVSIAVVTVALLATAVAPAASSVDNPTGLNEGFDPDWTFPALPNQKWHDAAGVDIDADRYDELIVASSNALWAFDDEHNLTQTPEGPMPSVLWRHRVGYMERFKVADLQGDGRPELVASVFAGPGSNQCTGHAPGQISVYDAITGDWIASYEGPYSASIRGYVLADLNNDGVQDIVVSNTDDQNGDSLVQEGFDGVFALDGAKLLAHGDPGPAGVLAAGPEDVRMWVFEDVEDQPVSASFRNIDAVQLPNGDSIVLYHGYSRVFGLDGENGTVEWVQGFSIEGRPTLADTNGDDTPEAILQLSSDILVHDPRTGDHLRTYDAIPSWKKLVVTSINGDDHPDFVVLGREMVNGPEIHRYRLWGIDGASDEELWEIDLGTSLWDASMDVVELDGEPGSEILLEEGQGFYMEEGLWWNQHRRPVMLAIDPHEGVIEWEQWVHSHADGSLTAANLDGEGHTEVVNVGYKLLSGWEPALDESKTAHEDDEYGGLSAPTSGCLYPVR